MQLDDRLSEEIIKIFHNSKGSIQNNIIKWTNPTTDKHLHEKANLDTHSEHPRNLHAAGQYEPRLQQNIYTRPEEFLNNSIEKKATYEVQSTIQKGQDNEHPKGDMED